MSQKNKREAWLSRKRRIRKKWSRTPERPRLSVFRSSRHIYAQIIDDIEGRTLAAASSREKEFEAQAGSAEGARGNNRGGAAIVGKLLGDRVKAKGVEKVVFDRNGFIYHGRVKMLADAVRETGVKF